jgi:hypothetical protein
MPSHHSGKTKATSNKMKEIERMLDQPSRR